MPSLEGYKSELDYSYAPGIFPSMECLTYRPENVRRLLVHSSALGREGIEKLCALAERHHIRIEEADKALSRISGKENCYAAAVFSKSENEPDPEKPHIVLHNPSDNGNIGTILRTALGLGVEDVALVRPCADVFDPKTVRASMGAMFRLRIRIYDRFEEYRNAYPERTMYPFMLDASVPLQEAVKQKTEKWTLIFGNEGRGLPAEFASYGQAVRIESSDKVDSLNLAMAAGIGMSEFMKE